MKKCAKPKEDKKMKEALKDMKKAKDKPGGLLNRANYED